jgi:GHH signature containing HNH/Endo VII superfamily nuclease toxin
MIETEDQRRWWFATHPEYSWSRRGIKREGGVDPEEVDKYVDEALQYETGPVADLLKSVKRNFGTEGNSQKPHQRLAFLAESQPGPDKSSSANEKADQREPTFWDTVFKGIDNTLQEWQQWVGLGARLPPKGTPEYNKIKAAREKGVRLKQAEELDNIRAGDKGSGVWSEEELERIRKTGKFPDDAVWHHDPTVANRPDLAADPRVVRPMRGGSKAHLRDGHGGNYQYPRE